MAPTVLGSEDIDDYWREVQADRIDGVLQLIPTGITLGAAIELACWLDNCGSALEPRVVAQLQGWAKRHKAVTASGNALLGRSPTPRGEFIAHDWEIRAIPTRNEFSSRGSPWALFGMRFARSLREKGGFDPDLARALTQALNELVDNVLEHAGPVTSPPSRGVVGYRVVDARASFVVGDVGQGVLNSLRTNPRYSHFSNSEEALLAVVRDHATRRLNFTEGNGIKQVFASLADLQGTLRFRSADAVLTLNGGFYNVPLILARCPRLPGLQIAITCGYTDGISRSPGADEIPLDD